jgi:hypothetical protein
MDLLLYVVRINHGRSLQTAKIGENYFVIALMGI